MEATKIVPQGITTGYLLVADLLGFSQIVNNSVGHALDERINAWVDLVTKTAKTHGIENIQLVSDTLFVGAPSSHDGLAGLISFSRDLLSSGLDQSFPIRGAIVHGLYSFGKLTYGKAVIAAHELEQAQNWIGVACAPNLPLINKFWSLDKVVCYPVPLKKGPIMLHPVISWPIPRSQQLMQLLMGGGLVQEQEAITWQLGEKMNNTILFKLYLDSLERSMNDCSRFYSVFPAHAIESELFNVQ